MATVRVGILASHPIQYHAPWFRALAKQVELEVFFAHRPTPKEQAAGFGGAFVWDVDLLSGYRHKFLVNKARRPGLNHFFGCDTPEIAEAIGGQRSAEAAEKRFHAFVVCGWNLKCYWQAVRACRRTKVPIFIRGDSQLGTPRSAFRKFLKQFTYPIILRQFDGFLSVGKRNVEYLRRYGVPRSKIHFAPHCVDNDWFAQRADEARVLTASVRASWSVNKDAFVILYVGKFQRIKRPGDILTAVSRLRDRAIDAIAIFVGAGELELHLRKMADSLRVRVQFEGFKNQTELPRYYAAADVVVLPSESETWGLSINEGMACGVPAVVSDVLGCAPDLIEQGQTGFTFNTGDSDDLARKLEMLFDLKRSGHAFGPALASKMRAYSVERAVSGTVQAISQFIPDLKQSVEVC